LTVSSKLLQLAVPTGPGFNVLSSAGIKLSEGSR
jgi:hypothetical protein